MSGVEAIRLEPYDAHQKTVIWLHGIGQDGRIFAPLVQEFHLPERGVRNVFLQAPARQAFDDDQLQSVWFEQRRWNLSEADPQGLEDAIRRIDEVIDEEARAVGPDNVVLAGFSQGAALALIVGLRRRQAIGGMALYAPYLLRQGNLRETRTAESVNTRIWIGHGDCDRIVPPAFSERIAQLLESGGYAIEYRRYPDRDHEAFIGVEETHLANIL